MSITSREVAVLVRPPQPDRSWSRIKNIENYVRGQDHHKARLSDQEVFDLRITYFEWREQDARLPERRRRGYLALAMTMYPGRVHWVTVRDIVRGFTRRSAGGPIYEALA